MTAKITADMLQSYAEIHEMVYQFCGEFMEVSNDTQKENKETLLGYFRRKNRVKVYTKQDRRAKEGRLELADWSTDDDVLFLLDGVGGLICIPRYEVLINNLIAA